MLTKSGTKLLDFGLAKLRQDAVPGTPLSQLRAIFRDTRFPDTWFICKGQT